MLRVVPAGLDQAASSLITTPLIMAALRGVDYILPLLHVLFIPPSPSWPSLLTEPLLLQSTKRLGKRSKPRRPGGPQAVDYIDDFFAQHPDFDYNSSKPIWTEFYRMCDDFEWDTDDYEMRDARRKFKSAMVQQFNNLYGTDQDDLNAWQTLCHFLKIEPVPEGLKKCRQVSVRVAIMMDWIFGS
jgi:hypothetical protein